MFPGLAWRPVLDLTSSYGNNLNSALSALSSEWFKFLQQRLKQDLAFYEKLSACKKPEEAYATCTDFYMKAMQDYPQEFLRLTRIASQFAGTSAEAAYNCLEFNCDENRSRRGSMTAAGRQTTDH